MTDNRLGEALKRLSQKECFTAPDFRELSRRSVLTFRTLADGWFRYHPLPQTELKLVKTPMRAAALCLALCVPAHGFVAQSPTPRRAARRECASPILCAEPTPEEITKKYGFEAGIFNALKSGGGKDGEGGGMVKAGDLLKRYGGAYLLTSTSLALVSFGLCYVLVDNGVDVAGAWRLTAGGPSGM